MLKREERLSLRPGKILALLCSLPITLYVNFRCLPFKTALKLPIFVGYKTHIAKLSGKIVFGCAPTPFMVRIGFGGTRGRDTGRKNYILVNDNATLQFNGRCTIASGVSIMLDLGHLEFGKDFLCNKNCSFSVNSHVKIGDGTMFGWDVELLDSDNHTLIHSGQEKAEGCGDIQIGNHVWVASFSHLLKNSVIPDGSVVAYRSLVTKRFDGEKLLIGGSPAKVLEEQIEWER